MSRQNLEYYIEPIGEKVQRIRSFNLWAKQGSRYYNLATLFYQDNLCGTQWSVNEIGRAVSYNESELQEELENPLRKIQQGKGKELLSMKDKSPEEVMQYITNLVEKSRQES